MKHLLLLLGLLCELPLLAMDNFQYLSNSEGSINFPGDVIRFYGHDTLFGPMHSNDWIATQNALGGIPTFWDLVSTSQPSFRPGSPNPAGHFFGGPPVFNAPVIGFPDSLYYIRQRAREQGRFLYLEGEEWYGSASSASITLYHWPEGTALDTTTTPFFILPIDSFGYVIFVDGKLDIRAQIAAEGCQLLIGCSRDIRIVDNIILEGTDLFGADLPDGATSRIALASEQGIYIANTPQNGREGCHGSYSNHDLCHVTITALLYAMGTHFQMEEMNDVGDPYISPVTPDERGSLFVRGGITQKHHGYLHRSNLGGTGYDRIYTYDERLRHWRTGVFAPLETQEDEFVSDADELLFPNQFTLHIAPNPFNANTTIRFTLPAASVVSATVFDVLGQEVMRLTDQTYSAGNHVLTFDGSGLASGVYFLTFRSGQNVSTHKLMLLK